MGVVEEQSGRDISSDPREHLDGSLALRNLETGPGMMKVLLHPTAPSFYLLLLPVSPLLQHSFLCSC